MPTFEITSPDGSKYRVTAPDGASQQDVLDRVRAIHASNDIKQQNYGDMSAGDIAKSAIQNAPQSAVNLAKDTVQAIAHPIDTATNIGKIGEGVLQKLGIMSGDDAKPYADAVGKFLVDRYGSGEAIKKTIATDPVGMAADIATVLSGGEATLARAPGVVGKLGEVSGAVGRAVDPLSLAGKAAVGGGKLAAKGLGVTTGVGEDAIKIAAQAGAEGGESGKAFRDAMSGATPADQIVNEAKGAVSNLRKERGDIYRKEMAKLEGPKETLWYQGIAAKNIKNPRQSEYWTTDLDKARAYAPGGIVRVARESDMPPEALARSQGGVTSALKLGEGGNPATVIPVKSIADLPAKTPDAEFLKLGGYKILDFKKVDDAVQRVAGVKNYKGQDLSGKTADIRKELTDAVDGWKNLDPKEFHTAEGLDALKQKIGDIRDATQHGTPARVVANNVYNAVKATIVKEAPEYAGIMKGYQEASDQIKEIERTLSVNPKASVDTALRKIMTSLRDNVNTNFGKRKELVGFLVRSGATHLLQRIAGMSLSKATPRGLQAGVASGEMGGAATALFAGHPAIAGGLGASLAASSPALVGAAAYGAGAASRLPLRRGLQASRLIGASGQ